MTRRKSAAQHHPTDHCYQYEPKRRINSHDFLNVIFQGRPCWSNSRREESSHAEMSQGPEDGRHEAVRDCALGSTRTVHRLAVALSTNMVNAAIVSGACARTMAKSPEISARGVHGRYPANTAAAHWFGLKASTRKPLGQMPQQYLTFRHNRTRCRPRGS